MPSYSKDKCPVCGHAEFRTIGALREKVSAVPVPDGSVIAACRNCKLIYVNPMPYWNSEDFLALYDNTYFSFLESEEQREWFNIRENVIPHKRYRAVEPYLKSETKKMLEVGAGEYAFMCRHLIGKGWNATAQEPGKTFAEKLRGIDGLNVETRDILELDDTPTYSFIYADSVMEHVPDPVEYYKKLSGLLLPGGVIYTVSPNEYSMYNFLLNIVSKSKGKNPHYISPYIEPYHLLGFTRKSLEILGSKSSLKLISYRKKDDYKAFIVIKSNRNAIIKYPLAALYAVSQSVGLGTNGECLFCK